MDESQHPYLKIVRESKGQDAKERLTSPEDISRLLQKEFDLDKRAEEMAVLLALNTKHVPIGIFEISRGTIDAALMPSREIMIRALLSGATCIVTAHNHPSGDLSPSQEDIRAAKRLTEACNFLNVPLLDNLIIKDGYYSFREEGLL